MGTLIKKASTHTSAEDGREYYEDPVNGESTWTKPTDLSWVQAHSVQHSREYYHYTVTQVKQQHAEQMFLLHEFAKCL